MRKPIFFVQLMLFCMVQNGTASSNEFHDDKESTQAWSHRINWPSSPWWRIPPWWLHRPPHHRPSPTPPENHHKPHSPVPGHHHHRRRHGQPPRHHEKRPPPSPPAVPPPPVHVLDSPKRDPSDCSTALIYVDGCVSDLITSFFRENVSVNANCCQAIKGLSNDCFSEGFTHLKTPTFTNKVKDFCAQRQQQNLPHIPFS